MAVNRLKHLSLHRTFTEHVPCAMGSRSDSVTRNPPASAGGAEDVGSVPGSGGSPGGGNGNPLQDSCLEKSHGQRSLVGYSP